jgi:hypothetical protein
MNMDLYITKHRIIQDYLHQLTTLINGTLDRTNATLIAELINKTTGVLNMHLASEDSFVYPKLLESSDTRVRSITQRYMDEMTKIADAYLAFHKKYNTPSKILADTAEFKQTFKKVRDALLLRMEREEKELYTCTE